MTPKTASAKKIKSVPDLVRNEGVAILLCTAVLFILSAIVDAPLQGPADPAASASPQIKAPWIFVGVQFMLKFVHPLVSGLMIPLGVLVVCVAIPFVQLSQRLKNWVFFSILMMTVVCSFFGYVW